MLLDENKLALFPIKDSNLLLDMWRLGSNLKFMEKKNKEIFF